MLYICHPNKDLCRYQRSRRSKALVCFWNHSGIVSSRPGIMGRRRSAISQCLFWNEGSKMRLNIIDLARVSLGDVLAKPLLTNYQIKPLPSPVLQPQDLLTSKTSPNSTGSYQISLFGRKFVIPMVPRSASDPFRDSSDA